MGTSEMATAVPVDHWHVICTVLKVLGILALLHYQGVLHRRFPFSHARSLWRRLSTRFRTCPHRSAAPRLGMIAFIGSILLALIGMLTRFLNHFPRWPDDSMGAARALVVTMVMPGFVEEMIFRGLFLRECHGGAGGAWESQDSRSVELPLRQEDQFNKEGSDLQPNDDVQRTTSSTLAAAWPRRPPRAEQAATLAIFIIYHRDVIHCMDFFRDWRFILLAAILGVCC